MFCATSLFGEGPKGPLLNGSIQLMYQLFVVNLRYVVYSTAILMPRSLSVLQSAGLIGDWQRLLPESGLRQLLLPSSATPSETKNRNFCGEPDVPFPGVLIALLIWGKMFVN